MAAVPGSTTEPGAKLHIYGCRAGLYHRTHAYGHIGALGSCVFYNLFKNLMSEVATVCKLESTHTALIASLDYGAGSVCVVVVEHGHNRSLTHLGQYGQFIEFCHCL